MKRQVRVADVHLDEGVPRKRTLWPLSGALLFLSLVVAGWLFYEVGGIGFSSVSAADGKAVGSDGQAMPEEIRAKEASLKEKEEDLVRRESAMADRERILQEQIQSYQKTVADLKGRIFQLERKGEENTDSFLSIYEKMEPKRAALIFDKLEAPLAIRILGRMAASRAAEILGYMSSDRARLLTERHLASTKVNEVSQSNRKGGE